MDLYQYFLTQNRRNILKNPHYFPIYERHFHRFVGHTPTMFEIGTGEGGSCLMWKYYFGPMARIVTIDIEEKRGIEEPQIFVRRGNQADPVFLHELLAEFGPPDIVLDDGSHMMEHINASFDVIFPHMSRSGVYLVEDLDGAYWPDRGGGLGAPTSFVERAKHLIDQMNADFSKDVTRTILGRDLLSVSFYPMIVAIEKTPYLNKSIVRMPTPLNEL